MGFRPTRSESPVSRVQAGQRTASLRAGQFVALCASCGLDGPETEVQFHPKRRWRFDFAWPDVRLALESEGGTWSGGRHTRGAGYRRDLEKYNAATLLGWRMLRVPSDELCRLETVELVRAALAAKAAA